MTLSQPAFGGVEALYLGPSSLMADRVGPLLDQDEEAALSPSSSLEGKVPASPPLSFFSCASSLSPYQTFLSSPPPSPPHPTSLFLGTKDKADPLSLPWLGAENLLKAHTGADDGEGDDAFAGKDWMSEKIDLSEFDLDSLIGSCSEDCPSSPEDLLASLDSHVDMDLDSFGTSIPTLHDGMELDLAVPSISALPLELPLPEEPIAAKTEVAPEQELAMKSEPPSPASSPSPPSPAYTLELGSEVDVLEGQKLSTSLTATIIPDPSGTLQTTSPIVLSLPPSGHIVVLLTNKEEPSFSLSLPEPSVEACPVNDSDSDSGIESVGSSPTHPPSPEPPLSAGSARAKPYSKVESTAVSTPSTKTSRVKSVSGAPKVVEKKLKKMEQNKTAATRYRQKKRVEQELLGTELEGLEKRNRELTDKAESISREIQYLKDLMDEVRKRRGKTSSVA